MSKSDQRCRVFSLSKSHVRLICYICILGELCIPEIKQNNYGIASFEIYDQVDQHNTTSSVTEVPKGLSSW